MTTKGNARSMVEVSVLGFISICLTLLAFAIWIGFMCTVVTGFFLSGLYYEMGRQLVPLCCVTTLVWAKGIEFATAKARTGH